MVIDTSMLTGIKRNTNFFSIFRFRLDKSDKSQAWECDMKHLISPIFLSCCMGLEAIISTQQLLFLVFILDLCLLERNVFILNKKDNEA